MKSNKFILYCNLKMLKKMGLSLLKDGYLQGQPVSKELLTA